MNVKREFINHVNDREIKCAQIMYKKDYNDIDIEYEKVIILKCKYTEEEYQTFLNNLDFDYRDGFGTQYLFGTIWYTDGNWSERGEYDGSEWWQYLECPSIPKSLK